MIGAAGLKPLPQYLGAVECSDGETFWCSSEIVHHSSSAFTSNVGSVDDVSIFRIAKKTPPPLLSRRSFL